MQLGQHRSIRAAVTAITATLLGSTAAGAAESTRLDSSLLLYSETGRVKAAEGVFDLTRKLSERRTVGLRLTLDALTGSSPNGATPSSTVQTFTGPSGSSSYQTPAGETPLDNTFSDQRGALDGRLIEMLDRVTFFNAGGHISVEHDYYSFGANAGITRDFNRRNTTLGVSGAYTHDIVSPLGGAPDPLQSMPPPNEDDDEGEDGEGGSGKGKDIVDVVAGVTQVLGRKTIVRVDYSLSRSSGYLNDPYKILSLVQGRGAPAPGEPVDYLYERRPGSRLKQAVYGEMRRYIAGSVLNASYRYFWDDWGITSHTADVLLRVPVAGDHAVEPHVRWYRQNEADFYNQYLVEGQTLPAFASADSRLAAFDALTLGLKYSMPLSPGTQVSFTGEYYTQMGKRGPPPDFGVLSRHDPFPDLDAFMLRIGFSRDF